MRSAADKKFCLRLTVEKNALGKGKGISITESLTSFRLKKLEETRVKYGLKMSGRLMVVSCLETQMVSQAYIMVNWLKHYGKRIRSLVCVIRAVICS